MIYVEHKFKLKCCRECSASAWVHIAANLCDVNNNFIQKLKRMARNMEHCAYILVCIYLLIETSISMCTCIVIGLNQHTWSGIILCGRPANERRRYNVTPSLIGWAHTQNDPCMITAKSAPIQCTFWPLHKITSEELYAHAQGWEFDVLKVVVRQQWIYPYD